MSDLAIKGLPDRVHQELKKAAGEEGRSLNSYIISLLESCVEERERRKRMRQDREAFRRFVDSLPATGDSTPLIRQDRRRGH